jgi:hypothetical protein
VGPRSGLDGFVILHPQYEVEKRTLQHWNYTHIIIYMCVFLGYTRKYTIMYMYIYIYNSIFPAITPTLLFWLHVVTVRD